MGPSLPLTNVLPVRKIIHLSSHSKNRVWNWLYKWSPIPFLITESRKIIWPIHTSREIQNKISRSQKSQNSNSRRRKIDLYQESRKNIILNQASRKKYGGPSIHSLPNLLGPSTLVLLQAHSNDYSVSLHVESLGTSQIITFLFQ